MYHDRWLQRMEADERFLQTFGEEDRDLNKCYPELTGKPICGFFMWWTDFNLHFSNYTTLAQVHLRKPKNFKSVLKKRMRLRLSMVHQIFLMMPKEIYR